MKIKRLILLLFLPFAVALTPQQESDLSAWLAAQPEKDSLRLHKKLHAPIAAGTSNLLTVVNKSAGQVTIETNLIAEISDVLSESPPFTKPALDAAVRSAQSSVTNQAGLDAVQNTVLEMIVYKDYLYTVHIGDSSYTITNVITAYSNSSAQALGVSEATIRDVERLK